MMTSLPIEDIVKVVGGVVLDEGNFDAFWYGSVYFEMAK